MNHPFCLFTLNPLGLFFDFVFAKGLLRLLGPSSVLCPWMGSLGQSSVWRRYRAATLHPHCPASAVAEPGVLVAATFVRLAVPPGKGCLYPTWCEDKSWEGGKWAWRGHNPLRKPWAYTKKLGNVLEKIFQGEELFSSDACGCRGSADGCRGHWLLMWWEMPGEDEGGKNKASC